ncbi:MAG: hypothetical protein DMG52_32180 [Acidobacteria bacterium]|nr:MAG: hypothetical protein DMG52_32180 [Acidobacteriota bacterium]
MVFRFEPAKKTGTAGGDFGSTLAVAVPLSKTPPPVLGPPGTSGRLHSERSPVSMSADQRTAPDLAESGAAPVTSFRFPAPRIFAGNTVPTLDRKPAARVISTKPNNTSLERCIGKPFSQRPENL